MSSLPYLMCGGVSQEVADHEDPSWSPATLRWSKSSRRNPYSSRGLDKFEAVLVKLEAEKRKIVAQLGLQHGDALVRFVQSNSNDWVPIVVLKVKHPKGQNKVKSWLRKAPTSTEKPPEKNFPAAGIGREVKKSLSWKIKEGYGSLLRLRRRPSYYWAVVFLLILVCVVLFGRCFGIVCTVIWWYMVPNLKGNDAYMRKSTKEFGRRNNGKKFGGDHHLIVRSTQSTKMGVP